MLICPKCRTTYSSSLGGACYRDGEKLVDHATFMAAENDPLRGKVIAGKYRIIDRIGQGGMGMVYRAVQSGLSRHVALKILRRELNVEADTIARFQREANAMSLLTHPNTVRVYDFGQTDDGLLYLVMELLEGELLTTKLAREGAFDVLEAVRITQQVLRSLAEAHEKAIVHRDLKPDNIFVTRVSGHDKPMVKVLDFGIAKIVAPDRRVDQLETQAGTVFGTPRYMSPEQAQGAQLDARSDLYSVGTLLYQMLTGHPPFVDDDAVVVMAKHIRELPEPPRLAAPDRPIPPSLDEIVMKALAKDPAARYQNGNELATALEGSVRDILALRGRPSRAFSATPSRGRYLFPVLAVMALGVGYALYRALPSSGRSSAVSAQPLARSEGAENAVGDGAKSEGETAHVTIHTRPQGASVYRDGKKLGTTPLAMTIDPARQDIVRVELRLPGYQPLAAELTAKDGERMIHLTKTAEPAPRRMTARRPSTTRSPSRERPEPEAEPREPEPKAPSEPYERFE